MQNRKLFREIDTLYHENCNCDSCKEVEFLAIEAIDIAGWVKVMEELAKQVHEGKIKSGEVDQQYILETYKELSKSAEKGYGKDWLKVNKATGNISPEVLKMQQNIYKFSGAKNAAVLEEINKIMQKQLPWNEFKNEVLKLNPKYNKNYLQSEWQTANQSAKTARDWEYLKANTGLYPNLEYRTQGDNRVRDAHAQLQGIIAPIFSDFWKTHYPPNGWRCRCFYVQTAAEPTKPENIPQLSEKDFPKEFQGNVGISGQIFSEDEIHAAKAHPYFAMAKTNGYQRALESSKRAAPPNTVYQSDGKTLKVSPFADNVDLKGNIEDAKILIDEYKINIEVRAHLDGRILKNFKNPEYIIDGKLADRKEPETENIKNLRNIYRAANAQGCETLVISLKKSKLKLVDVMSEIEKKFKTFPNITTVYVIDKNGKSYKKEKQVNF